MFLICGLFLVASAGLSRKLFKGQLFNPMVAFFGVWFIVLGLYALNDTLQIFHYPLSEYAKTIMIASFSLFFLAAVTVAMLPKLSRLNPPIRMRRWDVPRITQVTKLVLVLFSLAVLIKYVILVRRYGNPFAALDSVRNDFFAGELQYPAWLTVLTTFGYLAILNLGMLFVLRRSRRVIWMTLWAFALVWLNDSTTAMRGGFLNSSIMFLSAVMVTSMATGRKTGVGSLARVSLVFLCLLTAMTVIFYFRSGHTITFAEGLLGRNYMYVVGPVPAYAYFLEHPLNSRVFGHQMFLGLYQLIDMPAKLLGLSFWTEADNQTDFAQIGVGPFNTGTYLNYFHSDFGEIGVVVFSFLMGAIATFVFVRAICNKRIYDIQFSAVAFAALVISIRGLLTSGRSFWIILLLVMLQYAWLRKPRPGIHAFRDEEDLCP